MPNSDPEQEEMRICVLPYYSYLCPRLENEISALIKSGFDVDIYMWDRNDSLESSDSEYNIIPVDQSAPDRIDRNRFFSMLFIPLYYIKLYRNLDIDKYDLVLCPHPFLLPFSQLVVDQKPIVYDSREMYSVKLSEIARGLFGTVLKKAFLTIENSLVKRTDCVFTVDSANDKLIDRYRSLNSNSIVLYNVPQDDIIISDSRREELEDEFENQKIIVYVGGISRSKGGIRMVKALDGVTKEYDAKLLLIGHFVDSEDEIRKLISEKNLESHTELLGRVPYKEMMCYLSVSDIGLALHQPTTYYREYPSTGTGRKFFTYMQASLPVVGPEFSEVGEVVRETDCGLLVDSTDTDSVVTGIKYLLNHPKERTKMGQDGRKAIVQKYNWQQEQQKFVTIVSDLIDKDSDD